jgi:hypothetical protein
MVRINVEVIHQLGRFKGFMEHDGDITVDQANIVIDGLIENANNIERLAVRSADGSQTVFNTTILSSAILTFSISDDS